MSRSRKKTPIIGNAKARSEACDKKIWHGRFRSANRNMLKKANDSNFDEIIYPHVREESNPCIMSKDGRHFFPLYRQAYWASREADFMCLEDDSYEDREKVKSRYFHRIMGK